MHNTTMSLRNLTDQNFSKHFLTLSFSKAYHFQYVSLQVLTSLHFPQPKRFSPPILDLSSLKSKNKTNIHTRN